MRKAIAVVLAAGIAGILYFSMLPFSKSPFDSAVPDGSKNRLPGYRLVLISQESDDPFWAKVEKGAAAAANRYGASLEVWGSYGLNDVFLKNIEIAIASKVDGIIAQGLDTDEFNHLTKIKAAGKGIPVILIANDVPMIESLRRTYIGSDHLEAGRMIARQLLSDMGVSGKVIITVSDRRADYQRLRLNGILDILNNYPGVRTKIVPAGDARNKVVQAANQILNEEPDADAFIVVDAKHVSAITQEIEKRFRLEPYFIYSFDDGRDTLALLQQGKIDALIAQSPEAMGEESVTRMIQWLNGEVLPLDPDGYITPINVQRAEDVR